jgi:hypothetical protein
MSPRNADGHAAGSDHRHECLSQPRRAGTPTNMSAPACDRGERSENSRERELLSAPACAASSIVVAMATISSSPLFAQQRAASKPPIRTTAPFPNRATK